MTPFTSVGWALFAVMWVTGPITGYAASCLIACAWSRKAFDRRTAATAGISSGLLVIATTVLMLVPGL